MYQGIDCPADHEGVLGKRFTTSFDRWIRGPSLCEAEWCLLAAEKVLEHPHKVVNDILLGLVGMWKVVGWVEDAGGELGSIGLVSANLMSGLPIVHTFGNSFKVEPSVFLENNWKASRFLPK